MTNFRVALAQIAPALGDLQRNLALHLERVDRATADRGERSSPIADEEARP